MPDLMKQIEDAALAAYYDGKAIIIKAPVRGELEMETVELDDAVDRLKRNDADTDGQPTRG